MLNVCFWSAKFLSLKGQYNELTTNTQPAVDGCRDHVEHYLLPFWQLELHLVVVRL